MRPSQVTFHAKTEVDQLDGLLIRFVDPVPWLNITMDLAELLSEAMKA